MVGILSKMFPGDNYHSAMTQLKNDVILRPRLNMPLQASDNIIDYAVLKEKMIVSSDSSEESRQ